MDERYFRHIVYHRWMEGDIFRPLMSVPTLKEAVEYVDGIEPAERRQHMKVIDVEHIDMGDMLVHPDTQALISKFRQEAINA